MGKALEWKFVRGTQCNGKLFQQLHAIFFLFAIWIVQFIGPIMDEPCYFDKKSETTPTKLQLTEVLQYSLNTETLVLAPDILAGFITFFV